MEKPPVRKASRTLNLMKPAPRKTIQNGLIKDDVKSEENKPEVVTIEKDNKLVGKRATRGLRLEKPAPLKSSSKINIVDSTVTNGIAPEYMGSVSSEPCSPVTPVENVQGQRFLDRGDAVEPRRSAEIKANVLIKEALADMTVVQNSSKPSRDVYRQTKLLSQVSDDSGVGDMSWYSRQSSMLQSLSENQDDLDWDDIDNSPGTAFTLSSKQMACLPTAANQVQSLNSLMENDDILGKNHTDADIYGKVSSKRMRKNSNQTRTQVNRNQYIARSNSVPADLSNSNNNNHNVTKETEFWDDEADFTVDNMEKFAHSYTDTARSDRVRNLSEQNNKGKMDDKSRKRHATFAGNFVKGGNSCDVRNITVNVIESKHSVSFPKDWEANTQDVEKSIPDLSISVGVKNSGKMTTVSAINGAYIDPNATPRANSRWSKLTDNTVSSEKEMYVTEQCVKSDKNCDTSIKSMKTLPEFQNYRDKKDLDISTSSTGSSKSSENYLSPGTLEELDEQKYAWELIEDLSEKVDSIKLDEQKSDDGPLDLLDKFGIKEKSDEGPLDFLDKFGIEEKSDGDPFDFLDKFGINEPLMPFDLDAIEAELAFMTERDDLDLSESINSEKAKYFYSAVKTAKSRTGKKVDIVREPLHPHSTQEEIWYAEEGLPAGHCSAKGRRGMFRYHRECQIDEREAETTVMLIQYLPKELLLLGTKELSKQRPESWPYLTQIYPDICLKQMTNFDAELYALVREYVTEVRNVVDDKRTRWH